MQHDATPHASFPPRQLNGWKEISAFFGRSPRTVQRWERDFGLPIRRFGLGRAEVVHAYVEELEQWRATAETEAARACELHDNHKTSTDRRRAGPEGTPPQSEHSAPAAESVASTMTTTESRRRAPSFPRRYAVPLAVGLLAVAASGVLVWRAVDGGRNVTSAEPAAWDATADTLTVKNAAGQALWSYRFPFLISNRPTPGYINLETDYVYLEDVDGDGHAEVLAIALPTSAHDRAGQRLYAFSHDGRLRWTFAHESPQIFGDVRYVPPYRPLRIFVIAGQRREKAVWLVSGHSPWFPSVMSRLEPDGRVSAEYWSNGYITEVWEGNLGEERILVVGARNNESEGASVALLDPRNPVGSAPAATETYRCHTCPPGAPLHFIVLPKPARLRPLHGTSPVVRIQVDGNGRLVVNVNHARDVSGFFGDAIYTLDEGLRPVSVGLSDAYDAAVAVLVRKSLIPPPTPAPAIEEVRQVRWWDGARFIELTAPVSVPAVVPKS